MRCLIKIPEQSILMDVPGEPDEAILKLKKIAYRCVELSEWPPGKTLADVRTGDVCTFVGHTDDGKKAVVQWPSGPNRFTAVDWDSVEPFEGYPEVGA